MKNILVHADLGKAFKPRMAFAASLARKYGAGLSVLYVIPPFELAGYSKYAFPKAVLQERRQAEQQEALAAKAVMDDAVADIQAQCSWKIETGDFCDTLCGYARAADLLILGQRDESDIKVPDGAAPDRIILRAGRPVIVTPHVSFDETAGSRIMVAWDGSRESARALHDALPLLLQADQTEVVTFVEKKSAAAGIASVESIVSFLQRYGIDARSESLVLNDVTVGESILNRIVDRGANMLVMGGYGQSRLRELVLGGVTRTVLEHSSVPVLMSR